MKLTRRKSTILIEALEDLQLLSGGATSVIDLLVVYTPAARATAGGDAAIVSNIQQAVSDTNQAYANSQINLTMRLVHTELVNYTESGSIQTDLARLEGPSDGYMDSVQTLRDTYGADLVSLFTNIVIAPGNADTTGLGDVLLNQNYPNNDAQAFSVVGAAFAGAPDYTLAHETGHNLGGDHDRETAAGGDAPIFPYAYGYRFTGNDSVVYHDIMAYDPGTTIPYFSNPSVLYKGVPTGVPVGQPLQADLATTFAQTGPIVANYRPTVVPEAGPPTATVGLFTLSPDAHTLTFSVRYADDIALDVSTLDSKDLVLSAGAFTSAVQFVSVDDPVNGAVRTATYRVTSGGAIPAGPYLLTISANQVADTSANFIPGGTTLQAPIPTLTASPITSEIGIHYNFTVTYTDDGAVRASTLDSNDLRVTGPGGFDYSATFLSVNDATDGSPRTATYQIDSDYIEGWNGFANGVYQVVMQTNQVADTAGNMVSAGSIGSFVVAIAGPAPEASRDLGVFSGTQMFNDAISSTDTLDYYKFTIAATSHFTLSLTGLSTATDLFLCHDANNDGILPASENVDFAVSSTGTTMTHTLAHGVYYVIVQRDSAATKNTLYSLTFSANSDFAPPVATLNSATLSVPAATFDFTVTYTDATAVLASSLDTGDVRVTASGFSQLAAFVSVDTPGDGSSRTATYRLTPLSGNWSFAQNGAYTVALVAGQVSDTLGSTVSAQTLGTVTINIPESTPPAAVLTPATLSTTAAVFDFTVTYTDATAVLFSSLGTGDMQVTGPRGFSQQPVLVSVNTPGDGSPRAATYRLTPPVGNWSFALNGTYSVALVAGEVSDTLGNTVTAQTLGTVSVNIPDIVPPTATLNVATLSTLAAVFDFTVTYADATAVLGSSLGTGDLQVSGPNGFSQLPALLSVSSIGNGSPRMATYRLTPTAARWGMGDNGAYTVSLVEGAVSDTLGNSVAAQTLGSLTVNIPEAQPPVPSLNSVTLSAASTTFDFAVTYTDATGVLASSLGTGDVLVSGPGGFLQQAAFVSIDTPGNGSPRTATYRLTRASDWGPANNGDYAVSLAAGQVSDTIGNTAGVWALGTLTVNIPDMTPPAATLASAALVKAASSLSFTITYTDATAVLGSSLGTGAVLVTGPNGYSRQATLVSVNTPGDGSPRIVTYRLAAPSGSWGHANNGSYNVTLVAGHVSDTLGNAVAAAVLGTVTVNIPDTTPPRATLATPAKVTRSGGTSYSFKVTYTDDSALLGSTLGTGDIQVVGPHGFSQVAKFVSRTPAAGNPAAVTVTYKLTPPGGKWDKADNGTYTVKLLAAQVKDILNHSMPATTLGKFVVSV